MCMHWLEFTAERALRSIMHEFAPTVLRKGCFFSFRCAYRQSAVLPVTDPGLVAPSFGQFSSASQFEHS